MKTRRDGGQLRTTMRVAVAFVAAMLVLQLGFSGVYLSRSRQLTRETREQAVSLYSDAISAYYGRAEQLANKLLRESCVVELGHRQKITQANYKKVYNMVRLLKECASANEGSFFDIFVYFPRADMLYSQDGLCQRVSKAEPRYADIGPLGEFPMGGFQKFALPVSANGREYVCNVVGRGGAYAAVLITCPLSALTALSDASLVGIGAEAAYLDGEQHVKAASSALTGADGASLEALSGAWREPLKAYSFQSLGAEDGTIVLGFSREVPSESVRRNNVMVLIVNTMCLAAIAAFLMMFGRRVYMPLKKIVRQADGEKRASADDEFMRISAYIDTISGELTDYQAKYSKSLYENQLNRLALALQDEGDAAPMASESDYAIMSVIYGMDEQEDRALAQRIERETLSRWAAKPMSRQNRQIFYYITLPEGGAQAVAEALSLEMEDVPALFSVGGARHNLNKLPQAMEEARVALLRQAPDIVRGKLRICLYSEDSKVSLFSGLSVRAESALVGGIESGSLDACEKQLGEIFRESEAGSVFQQRDLCLYLLNLLLRGRPRVAEDVAPVMLRVKGGFRFPMMREMVIEQYGKALQIASQENEVLSGIQEFVTGSFGLPELSLQMVADHVGLSYSYLSKFIKQTTGEGFADYVTRLRVDAAKRMLAETDMLVGEISAAVGFSVFSSFSRAFKKCTGISPSEYKRLYAGSTDGSGPASKPEIE